MKEGIRGARSQNLRCQTRHSIGKGVAIPGVQELGSLEAWEPATLFPMGPEAEAGSRWRRRKGQQVEKHLKQMVLKHKRTSPSPWLVGGAAQRKRAHVVVAYSPMRLCEGSRDGGPDREMGDGRCGGSPERTSTSASERPECPSFLGSRMLGFSADDNDGDGWHGARNGVAARGSAGVPGLGLCGCQRGLDSCCRIKLQSSQ
ncbi:hypothetical protein QBC39DRAFT_173321 [Podospora conica]|nr:hypothetical protein QBC39DRAFT_173321 [Schizothecium conicum]